MQHKAVEKFNIQLVDETGRLLVRINDFSIRALDHGSATGGKRTSAVNECILYRPAWRESPDPRVASVARVAGAEPGAVLVFESRDEVFAAIKQQLQITDSRARKRY